MKLRAPESVQDAATQAIALLGADAIATALTTPFRSVSESIVRKWADPDADKRISFVDARAIDRLLLKTGHVAVFCALLELDRPAEVDPRGVTETPVAAALRMTAEAASLMDRVDQAMADGSLDGQEVQQLRTGVDRLHQRIGRFRRLLVVRKAVA